MVEVPKLNFLQKAGKLLDTSELRLPSYHRTTILQNRLSRAQMPALDIILCEILRISRPEVLRINVILIWFWM